MDTMTPECLGIWLLALAVIVVCGALALATSPTHPLTGPDATEMSDDDDMATANGEPLAVADDVIWIFADTGNPDAARMAWLNYVRVPLSRQSSQQHRQRLDGSESEAAHE